MNKMYAAYFKELLLVAVFTVIVVASGFDIVADISQGVENSHIVKEAIVMLVAILAMALIMFNVIQQQTKIKLLKRELLDVQHNKVVPKKYILETREKLNGVITKQFLEWLLTESEVEIGWLLIKGLSLKEIAMIRETKEKTVRQQASTIYKKAGVNGRHAFSAWFIEDIL